MVEKIYTYSNEDTKSIQKTIDDDHIMINYMTFPKGDGLSEPNPRFYHEEKV